MRNIIFILAFAICVVGLGCQVPTSIQNETQRLPLDTDQGVIPPGPGINGYTTPVVNGSPVNVTANISGICNCTYPIQKIPDNCFCTDRCIPLSEISRCVGFLSPGSCINLTEIKDCLNP